jgi:hypothetical protein
MPVAVRNLKRTLTVHSDIAAKTSIEWAPRGDPDGGDLQYVPDLLMEDTRFLKAVGFGILEIVDKDNPDLVASAKAQAAKYARTSEAEVDATTALIDRHYSGREIVISEVAMAAHIDSLSKGRGATIDTEGDESV